MSVVQAQPRWAWYRLLTAFPAGSTRALAFLREDDGTCLDQPLLYEWLRFQDVLRPAQRAGPAQRIEFAAVLGDPVHHSRTPSEHATFFANRGMPVLAITLKSDEVADGLFFLQSLGLRAAAVTAPLKASIGKVLNSSEPVNTIWKSGDTFFGASTDGDGFSALLLLAGVTPKEQMLIWGGKGVLPAVQGVAENAVAVSARTGLTRDGAKEPPAARVLVWAAGSKRGAWSAKLRPEIVIDLSYTEDSAGLEVALECKAKYVSGLQMFKAQARRQRELWEKNL